MLEKHKGAEEAIGERKKERKKEGKNKRTKEE